MYSILYKSIGNPDFDSARIFKMLLKAKKYNREKKISGCIIFFNGTFLQLLEGDEEEVKALFDRIKSDERHHDVEIIIQKTGIGRLWEDWSMAFYDLSGSDKIATQKRTLLEIYFNSANTSQGSDEVFNVFKDSAMKLLH